MNIAWLCDKSRAREARGMHFSVLGKAGFKKSFTATVLAELAGPSGVHFSGSEALLRPFFMG